MALIREIYSDSQLYHDLKQMGRNNFSYEGAKALQAYLEEYSEEIGEHVAYDPIAFCCEFTEYEDLEDLQNDYPDIESMDDLYDHTSVIEFKGGFIISAF